MFIKLVREIKNKGGNVVREAGPMMGTKLLLAFIEDPNGYKIELIQKAFKNLFKKIFNCIKPSFRSRTMFIAISLIHSL